MQGIIRALREASEALKAAKVHIFVRRGGPNYQSGLEMMRQLGREIGIPITVRAAPARESQVPQLPVRMSDVLPLGICVQVHGPEVSMTSICSEAVAAIK